MSILFWGWPGERIREGVEREVSHNRDRVDVGRGEGDHIRHAVSSCEQGWKFARPGAFKSEIMRGEMLCLGARKCGVVIVGR